MKDTAENRPRDQLASPGSHDDRRHATDHPRDDDDDTFSCGRCGAVFGDRHSLFLVRHREWNVDECSNCGGVYQVGRAKNCPARLRAQSGSELELPIRAWLAVNELLHSLGLISFRQFEAMKLDIGASADAAQAEWISLRLREEIKAAGGRRPLIERETIFRKEMAQELWTYLKQFMRFARRSGGFSVY